MPTLTPEETQAAIVSLFLELQKRGVVLSGDDSPLDLGGLVAPIGAEYVQTALNVQIKRFQKFGLGNLDWAETLSAGGGGGISPLVITGNETVAATWYQRPVHITAAAVITLSITTYEPPDGFMFIAIIETAVPTSVTFVREDLGAISTIIGELTTVGYSYQNAFIAFTFRNGKWFAVGQLTDES